MSTLVEAKKLLACGEMEKKIMTGFVPTRKLTTKWHYRRGRFPCQFFTFYKLN